MDWSAGQYRQFEDERSRPARDLLARVPNQAAATAVDLGCGPGNSTELLIARYPDAAVTGIDSSPDMIAAARARLPGVRFELADIAAWDPVGRFDVIFANASLQWLPDHAALLPTLAMRLALGGSLAVQLPDNLEEPAHRLMAAAAAELPFADKLRGAEEARAPRRPSAWYFQLLRQAGLRVDVWHTTYFHPLAGGADAVVDWFRSTGLRPYLLPLDAGEQAAFLARYRARIGTAYPALPDGSVLLPFPRLFIVATR